MPRQADRLQLELHCHSSFSFDGDVDPLRLVELAVQRQLTHLAITDHDTIDGALRARSLAPPGLTVIVGQEARTTEGDMIALFIERPIPSGLTPADTAAAIREQGGVVGLAHPFDVWRPSIGRGAVRPEQLAHLAQLVDYVEVHNGRVRDPAANARAADLARLHGLAPVAVSDAHTEPELGTVVTVVDQPVDSAAQLLSALTSASLVVREMIVETERRSIHRLAARLRAFRSSGDQ